MGTSYDEIWESFLENCGYDRDELPKADELRYSMIKNAIRYYNQRVKKYSSFIRGGLICDEITETLNFTLKDVEMLILSNVLGYIFCKNKLNEFVSTYSVFAKEMGFKDYKNQLEGRQGDVSDYENEIRRLIEDEYDTFTLQ